MNIIISRSPTWTQVKLNWFNTKQHMILRAVRRNLNTHTNNQESQRCHHHDHCQCLTVTCSVKYFLFSLTNEQSYCMCACVSSQCESLSWIILPSQMQSSPQLPQQGTGWGYDGGFFGRAGARCDCILASATQFLRSHRQQATLIFSSSWVCFQQLLEQSAWLNSIPNAAVLIKQRLGQTKADSTGCNWLCRSLKNTIQQYVLLAVTRARMLNSMQQ